MIQCKEGYIPSSEAYRLYGRGLTEAMFYLVMQEMSVDKMHLTIKTDDFVLHTSQMEKERAEEAIEEFYEDLVPEAEWPDTYTHWLFGPMIFQA